MKQNVNAHADLYQQMEGDLAPFFTMVVISIVCHFAFFAVVVLTPGQMRSKRFEPRIINVNLVALPRPKVSPAPKASPVSKVRPKSTEKVIVKPETPTPKRVEEKPVIKETVALAPKPEPEISVAPKPKPVKVKTSLKQKTFKPRTVVKPAIKRIEKKVKESGPSQIAKAINRLKDKVGRTEKNRRHKAKKEEQTGRSPLWAGMGNSGSGKEKFGGLIQIYKLEIAYRVQKNWAYSEQLAGRQSKLKALLVFKVMPDGEIKDVFFTDRSGDSYLDESAYKAVIKSNPVPPHPKGLVMRFITVGLRFTPEGVK